MIRTLAAQGGVAVIEVPPPPRRVVQIIWWNEIGGIAGNLVDLLEHVNREKFALAVCVLAKGTFDLRAVLSRPVEIVALGWSSGWDVGGMWRLFRFLRQEKYDVIHNHSRSFLASLAVVLAGRHTIRVFQEHGAVLHSSRARLFCRVMSRAYHCYIVVSATLRPLLARARVPSDRVIVIENGIDTEKLAPTVTRSRAKEQLGLAAGRVTVGTACRLTPEKDVSLFLAVAQRTIARCENVEFGIVGTGALEAELRREVRRLGLEGQVRFLGPQSNMLTVWRAFDLLLFTSLVEPFGRTPLEAQACGTAVVAAPPRLGGALDMLRESPGVVLVGDRNPETVAGEVVRLVNAADERQRLGALGREWVKARFDVRRWTRRIEACYREQQ